MLPGLTPFGSGSAGPVDLSFRETRTVANTTASAALFTGVNFGEPRPDRRLYTAISRIGPTDLNGVTIGGIAATKLVEADNAAPTPDLHAEIWEAHVPLGATGDVHVQLGGGAGGPEGASIAVSVYRVIQVTTPTEAIDADIGAAASRQSVLDVSPGGAVILAHGRMISGSQSIAWSGAAENSDLNVSSKLRHSAASLLSPTGGNGLVFTATAAAATDAAQCAVAIG